MKLQVVVAFCIIYLTACSAEIPSNYNAQPIRVALESNVGHLDPHFAQSRSQLQIVNIIYDRLIEVGDDQKLSPSLASNWEIRNNGLQYVFYLREQLSFHDNSSLDTEDIKLSLDRVANSQSKSPYRQLLDPIESIEQLDEKTLVINLKHRYTPLLHILAAPWMAVLPAEDATRKDIIESKYIGSGPYIFPGEFEGGFLVQETERTLATDRDENYTLYPNPRNRWDSARIKHNGILELVVLPDYERRITGLINNRVDVVSGIFPKEQAIFETMGGYTEIESPSATFLGLVLGDGGRFSLLNREQRTLFSQALENAQPFQGNFEEAELLDSSISTVLDGSLLRCFFNAENAVTSKLALQLKEYFEANSMTLVLSNDPENPFDMSIQEFFGGSDPHLSYFHLLQYMDTELQNDYWEASVLNSMNFRMQLYNEIQSELIQNGDVIPLQSLRNRVVFSEGLRNLRLLSYGDIIDLRKIYRFSPDG